jgi:hypothetical protein
MTLGGRSPDQLQQSPSASDLRLGHASPLGVHLTGCGPDQYHPGYARDREGPADTCCGVQERHHTGVAAGPGHHLVQRGQLGERTGPGDDQAGERPLMSDRADVRLALNTHTDPHPDLDLTGLHGRQLRCDPRAGCVLARSRDREPEVGDQRVGSLT